MNLPSDRLLAAAHEASSRVRRAGVAGGVAFHRGQLFELCPYYFETPEARAWKRAWILEETIAS